jgi:hypothetical protein
MALLYVAICGGEELTVMVSVKLFPATKRNPVFKGTDATPQHLLTIVSPISLLTFPILQGNNVRHYTTSPKVAGSIPKDIIELIIRSNLSSLT